MTLLRSGDNLFDGMQSFITQSKSVELYSPFVRVSVLESLLGPTDCSILVVRWQTGDILQGVTDFEKLFEYCTERGIQLYRNTDMHMKAIVNDERQVILGSANFTNKGVGQDHFNLELASSGHSLQLEDERYLKALVTKSELINELSFNLLKSKIEDLRIKYPKQAVPPEYGLKLVSESSFLMSALPMSWSPHFLWLAYNSESKQEFSSEEILCAAHDLANYAVPSQLTYDEFNEFLEAKFNNHPFISALKEAVNAGRDGSLNYGRISSWLEQNTETVPTPRRWEIKDQRFVNILQMWICFFDADYKLDRPNSGTAWLIYKAGQANLTYLDPFQNIINEILNIHVDSARGAPAPHKFIVLLTLMDVINSSPEANRTIDLSEELEMHFNSIWTHYTSATQGRNANLAMPLKSLCRDTIIEIENVHCSDRNSGDDRSYKQLKAESNHLKFRSDIWTFLVEPSTRNQIKLRIEELLTVRYPN
jgi:hypothetical protein